MSLKIYNSMSQKKEVFEALESGKVKMYVCGPTVYDFLHIGNFRGPIFFNLVRNWLEELGYDVTFVYNYTDVDDKIIQRALKEGTSSDEVSQRFIEEFEKDFLSLGLKKHNHNPRVTQFMPQIISMIERIIANEKAYVVEGEVFYSIERFEEYGKLSHKKLDELIVGMRVEVDAKKKNALDFTLWKPAKPGEPSWPSPWGMGRPGWHIECSAMCSSILGEQIDIHGGGIDLIFPHHENEIAQSEAASGKHYVKYWMHNNFINFGGEKMSKSLGNIFTARSFIEKYNAEIFKCAILSSHYRSQSDFGDAQIYQAIGTLAKMYSALAMADLIIERAGDMLAVEDKAFITAITTASEKIYEALNDDFNTPEVFASLFEVLRLFNSSYRHGQKITPQILAKAHAFKVWLVGQGKRMSLFQEDAKTYLRILDDMMLVQKDLKREDIDKLVAQRLQARGEKDYQRSDKIRDELLSMGIILQDMPDGTSAWEVQK